MNMRTLVIVLGVALAASVAVNLFAATAAYTALNGQERIEQRMDEKGRDERRPSSRELVQALDAGSRDRVRAALRAAGLAARPDFQQARELRRQAIAAAAAESFDAARVEILLDQSRAAEVRGRERLEADALIILGTLSPTERVTFSQILNNRKRAGGSGGRGAESNADKAK